MQIQLLIAIAINPINDTLGPEGFAPSALVFGEFPSFISILGPVLPRPILSERAEAAQAARRYMSQHFAQAKVNRALKHQFPAASHPTYTPGEQVLVWREKLIENRIGEWIDPYTVETVDHDSKIVVIKKTPG